MPTPLVFIISANIPKLSTYAGLLNFDDAYCDTALSALDVEKTGLGSAGLGQMVILHACIPI